MMIDLSLSVPVRRRRHYFILFLAYSSSSYPPLHYTPITTTFPLLVGWGVDCGGGWFEASSSNERRGL